jgi:hypothetical protein
MDHSARPRQDQKTLRARLGWQVPCTSPFPTLKSLMPILGHVSYRMETGVGRRPLGCGCFLDMTTGMPLASVSQTLE